VSGPTIYRVRTRSAMADRLALALCRRFGCQWEPRRGYDWCTRCGASEWHIARRVARAA
jgi:hypothetical protein